MQLLASSELMREFDQTAISKFSVPGIILMENAGRAFVDVLSKHVGSLEGKVVLVVCGKGNNGGDGFVIARHLYNKGAKVEVILLASKRTIEGDAKVNLDILLRMKQRSGHELRLNEIRTEKSLSAYAERLAPPDIIVDAIFGTGFTGQVTGIQKKTIEWIDGLSGFKAAVDIPSGVNATTGVVENIAVKSHLTVTMGMQKIGLYLGRGRDHSGKVEIVDISIPKFVFARPKFPTFRVKVSDVRRLLPRRAIDAHKYSVGRVLVIAGSRNLTGAPLMTALSAMRTGAGAVILAIPKSIHAPLIRKATEVMITPLAETEDGSISLEALTVLQEKIAWADAVALGPGLGQNFETREVVYRLLRLIEKPLVLDADALSFLADDLSPLKRRKIPTVVTPHVGEFRSMTKLQAKDIEANRVERTREWAKKFGCTLVLKGVPTTTGNVIGNVYVNSTGNPGMATAGSGDVLTGIIVSLIAQGMLSDEAAWSGVLIHGLAGDSAAGVFGARGLMAMDILQKIPSALREIDLQ
jgi:ADP-dependent NAD(P)H-hydrate dehydratase / NAD(P)H-hydrate epimerase